MFAELGVAVFVIESLVLRQDVLLVITLQTLAKLYVWY
jgi:hypothetical protein